nr:ABC transporter permease subunit [Chloroflexota bacterium]
MLRNVFVKNLRDQRKAMFWWVLGLLILVMYLIWFYPGFRDRGAFVNEYIQQLPPALRATFMGELTDFTSPEGYLNTEMFFFTMPMLLLIFTIGFGSAAIAGEEERGTLDLLLANPIPRWRVVLEKWAALLVLSGALVGVVWLGVLASVQFVELEINFAYLAQAFVSLWLLSLTFGTLALALGSIRGRRGLSAGVTSALAVAAYFLNSLAPLTDTLKPYRKLSLFYYYIGADPLSNGLDVGHAAVLVGVTVMLAVVALVAFHWRDVGV